MSLSGTSLHLGLSGLSIKIWGRNQFGNLEHIIGDNHPSKIFKSTSSQLLCQGTQIVYTPFTGGPTNCYQHLKVFVAITKWTHYLAISEGMLSSADGKTISSCYNLLWVKGQSNTKSAPKNNFVLPATCEELALRLRKHGQGRKKVYLNGSIRLKKTKYIVRSSYRQLRHCCVAIVNSLQCLLYCECLRVKCGICATGEYLGR